MWQVVFTAELRRRLPAESGIVAAAVHPGEVMTDVVRTLPGLMQSAYRFFMRPFCLSPAEGLVSCCACSGVAFRGRVMKSQGLVTTVAFIASLHDW